MVKLLIALALILLFYLLYKELKSKKKFLAKQEELEGLKAESEVLDVEEEIALQKAENKTRQKSLKEFENGEK